MLASGAGEEFTEDWFDSLMDGAREDFERSY